MARQPTFYWGYNRGVTALDAAEQAEDEQTEKAANEDCGYGQRLALPLPQIVARSNVSGLRRERPEFAVCRLEQELMTRYLLRRTGAC